MITTTNIPRYARIFKILCIVFIPIAFLFSPLMWLIGDKDALGLITDSYALRLSFALIDLVSSSIFVYGLFILARIANNFQKDEIFRTSTVALFMRLRRIAGWWALYNIGYIIFFHIFNFLYNVIIIKFPASFMITAVLGVIILYTLIFVFLSLLATLIVKATQLQGDQDLTV